MGNGLVALARSHGSHLVDRGHVAPVRRTRRRTRRLTRRHATGATEELGLLQGLLFLGAAAESIGVCVGF